MLVTKTRSFIAPLLQQNCRAFHTSVPSSWPSCLPRSTRKSSVPSQRCGHNLHIAQKSRLAAFSTCKTDERSIFGALEVQRIPCLSDNYAWLIRDQASAKTAIVDPSESGESNFTSLLVKVVRKTFCGTSRWQLLPCSIQVLSSKLSRKGETYLMAGSRILPRQSALHLSTLLCVFVSTSLLLLIILGLLPPKTRS